MRQKVSDLVTMNSIPEHELSRLEALARADQPLEMLIERRKNGEPLQYIEVSRSSTSREQRLSDPSNCGWMTAC